MSFVGAPKRIQWKSQDIGDYSYVYFDYQGNVETRIIPRAKGMRLRSTEQLGGGLLNITVQTLVAKADRTALENFIATLDNTLSLNVPGDLVVYDENGTYTLSDCYLESFSQTSEDLKANLVTFKFVKSL